MHKSVIKLYRPSPAELTYEILCNIDWDIHIDTQVFVDTYFDGTADAELQVLGPFAKDTESNRVWTLTERLEM